MVHAVFTGVKIEFYATRKQLNKRKVISALENHLGNFRGYAGTRDWKQVLTSRYCFGETRTTVAVSQPSQPIRSKLREPRQEADIQAHKCEVYCLILDSKADNMAELIKKALEDIGAKNMRRLH